MTKNARISLVLGTCMCLVPTLVGLLLWNRLPQTMAIHWGVNMQPNGWASRPVVVFALPLLMAALNAGLLVTNEHGLANVRTPKVAAILYWIIPVLTVSMMALTFAYAFDERINVGRFVLLVVGILFVVIGNYTPKMSYETARTIHHPAPRDEASWRRTARISGIVLVLLGFASLILAFFV